MATNKLPNSFIELFKECFEGIQPGKDYTWFVQGKEGIFDAFEGLTAKEASRKLGRASSIAGHCYHIRFALKSANAEARGEQTEGTWESSWDKQDCTPEEWAEIASSVREEYETILRIIESNEDWSDLKRAIGALALLPHMAYHLGAIRLLMTALES